jgi:hypothetical protein
MIDWPYDWILASAVGPARVAVDRMIARRRAEGE